MATALCPSEPHFAPCTEADVPGRHQPISDLWVPFEQQRKTAREERGKEWAVYSTGSLSSKGDQQVFFLHRRPQLRDVTPACGSSPYLILAPPALKDINKGFFCGSSLGTRTSPGGFPGPCPHLVKNPSSEPFAVMATSLLHLSWEDPMSAVMRLPANALLLH